MLQKTETPKNAQVAQSVEQRTENPRVENSVITPTSMNPEGSDLIEEFFMNGGFVLRGSIPVFLTSVDLSIWIMNRNRPQENNI